MCKALEWFFEFSGVDVGFSLRIWGGFTLNVRSFLNFCDFWRNFQWEFRFFQVFRDFYGVFLEILNVFRVEIEKNESRV